MAVRAKSIVVVYIGLASAMFVLPLLDPDEEEEDDEEDDGSGEDAPSIMTRGVSLGVVPDDELVPEPEGRVPAANIMPFEDWAEARAAMVLVGGGDRTRCERILGSSKELLRDLCNPLMFRCRFPESTCVNDLALVSGERRTSRLRLPALLPLRAIKAFSEAQERFV